MAYNEVMVALLEDFDPKPALRKFARDISLGLSALLLLFVATPLSRLWLQYIAALPLGLIPAGRVTLALAIPLGVLSVYISYYQLPDP